MPDTITPLMQKADGFVVISRHLRAGSIKPPYQYRYEYEWFPELSDAVARYTEYERHEYDGWEPVAMLPVSCGVPLGSFPFREFSVSRLAASHEEIV